MRKLIKHQLQELIGSQLDPFRDEQFHGAGALRGDVEPIRPGAKVAGYSWANEIT